MRRYNGSFTLEASYVLPVILICICIVVDLAVVLHAEVCTQVEVQLEKESLDVITVMYQREYLKELFGE